VDVAYRNFFASITGKRKGRKVAPPRFRSRKDNRQAIRFTNNSRFKVLDNGRLRLPKIGDVPLRWSRNLPSEASSVTVIRDAAGRYFASFVVQITDGPLPQTDCEIGIDLGLTHFAVMSDGTKVTAPKFLRRAARKLKRLHQDLSRKQRGSQNRKKAVVNLARGPRGTGAPLPGWTGSSRPPGCAATAAGSTTRWRSMSERGIAPAEQPTTGTSTPRRTSRPPDRRTSTTVERR
jgi:transposase